MKKFSIICNILEGTLLGGALSMYLFCRINDWYTMRSYKKSIREGWIYWQYLDLYRRYLDQEGIFNNLTKEAKDQMYKDEEKRIRDRMDELKIS